MAIILNPKKIRNKLFQVLCDMENHIVDFVRRPGHDFTRQRFCTFTKTIMAIMLMECHDLDKEIMGIFTAGKKKYSRKDLVTSSAFVQARNKFNDIAFPSLFNEVNRLFPFTKTKNGMHIIAIDGSDINVPADKKDCNTFIPYNSNNGGYHQMHINCAYDLLEQRYSDVVIQPRAEMNEVSAACKMAERKTVKGKCLYIADRAYFSFNLIAHIMENKDYFLIRLKNIYSEHSPWQYIAPPEGKEFDIQSSFILTRSRKKVQKAPAVYKHLSPGRDFDYIEKRDSTSEYKMPFRLIAVKLDNDTFEYLLTNLPKEKIDNNKVKDYYSMRWNIEESFLFLKYGISLNYFHSVKREFLIQEIYAKLVMYNYISLLVSCVSLPDDKLKYKYKIAFKDAIIIGRDFLLKKIRPKDVIPLLESYKTPIRPDRKYLRKVKSQRLRTLQHRA